MKFEWDEEKNRENVRKHALDFADAWEIFDAPVLVNFDIREDYGEERQIGIGFLKNFVIVVLSIPKVKMLFASSLYERL